MGWWRSVWAQPWQVVPSAKVVTAGTQTSPSLSTAAQHSSLSVMSEHLAASAGSLESRRTRACQRVALGLIAVGATAVWMRAPTPQVP